MSGKNTQATRTAKSTLLMSVMVAIIAQYSSDLIFVFIHIQRIFPSRVLCYFINS